MRWRLNRRSSTTHHRRGLVAEHWARVYLALKGYRLVARRYKTPLGEIDLIMRRGRTLVCVEVKARPTYENAAASLHSANQARVARAAQLFLAHHPAYATYHVRFDAVLIVWYSWPRHIPHAFAAP